MVRARFALCSASFLVVLAYANTVLGQESPQQPKPEQRVAGLVERLMFLLPPGAETKLKLSEEQFDRINKLQYEFRSKRRDALLQIANQVAAAIREADDVKLGKELQAEKVKPNDEQCSQIGLALFTSFIKMRGLRDDYEMKVCEVLNAEQKKQFAELQREQFRLRAERREERRDERGSDRQARGDERGPAGAASFPELNLTAEQKTKLGEMHRELEVKFQTMLTAEQKRQWEEWKSRRQQQNTGAAEPRQNQQQKP